MDLCVPSIRVKSDSKVQTGFVPNSRQSRRWFLSQPHSGQTSLIDHCMADAATRLLCSFLRSLEAALQDTITCQKITSTLFALPVIPHHQP